MLRLVCIALLGLALLTTCRWLLRRRDSLGRRQPFPTITVGFCLVLALIAAVPLVRHARLEARLSDVSSSLVAAPVEVHCATFSEEWLDAGAELGRVAFGRDGVPERRAVIRWEQCRDLAAYLGSDRRAPSREQVVAVHIVTHEAMHMAGTTNEAETECRAMQRNAATARLLGAPPDGARALAGRYWREVYPHLVERYRSRDCAPGGPLDEGLPDAPWH